MSVAEAITIKVGVFDNRPIVFQEAPGQYAGLSIDVLESIAKQEDLKLQYIHGSWKTVLSYLETGEIDLLVGIAHTTERTKIFDYTNETLINNWGVVYRNPSISISSLADLQGKRVALMTRSIHARVFKQLMNKFQFKFEAVEVPTYLSALQAAEQGEADAAVINRVISLLNASKHDIIETSIIFNPVEVRFAAPKGKHKKLLSTIDRYIFAQKQDINSPYHKSLNKWLSPNHRTKIPDWVTYATGVAILILIILGISNYLIRRQVATRTAELSESELRFRQLTEAINEVFWIGSPDWQQIYYVSPAYEVLWGHKRESLYANPSLWFDSVHPDDKKKVSSEIKKKASGDLKDPAFSEYRIITTTGETHWILARAYPIHDEQGKVTRIAGIAEDITSRKKYDEKINFMAHHDPLTQLKNRYAFEKELVCLMREKKNNGSQHALLYIDLDQFKIVNDTCGHTAGDKMLAKLANLLHITVGTNGIIARLGGDEFGVILHNTTLAEAKILSQELLDSIKTFRFLWQDKRFSVGASIGLVMINDDQLNELDLLSAADMACYAAKERGRNRVHIYTHDDADLLQRHGEMQWVSRINQALEDDRFVLHRQMIRPLQTTQSDVQHYEYLVRLLDEQGNLVLPNSFLPAAERFELMLRLDRWIVSHIFVHLQLTKDCPDQDDALAFINLSGQVFTDEKFIDFLIKESQLRELDPGRICLEITETAAISNLSEASRFISRLRQEGFKFALDDFGTGMSSFSYLKSLQIDYLKIDGIFIKDLLKDPMNSAIVESVTNIGHKANLKIIAEWVESEEVLDQLISMGVDYGQGYAIDKPTSLPEITQLKLVKK